MAMTTKKEKKQSKGVAGSGLTSKELEDLKFKERLIKMLRGGKGAFRGQGDDNLLLKPEMMGKDIGPMKDGGEVKKYKKGGSVKKKNKMITTRGFGASRKT